MQEQIKMRTGYRLLCFVSVSALLSLAQGVSSPGATALAPPAHPAWLTDAVVFEFLFKHVSLAELRANELQELGKDDSSERHLFKNAVKLSDQEEAVLKSTASNTETALTAYAATAAAVIKPLKAQYPTASSLPPSALQQLQGLSAQRQQIIQTNMAALQSGMSAATFQKLYRFAWGAEAPRIKLVQPQAKPPAGVSVPPAIH